MNTKDLNAASDDRGFIKKLWTESWYPGVKQCLLSYSLNGTIRAWHKHERGQNDLLTVITGRSLVVYLDGERFVETILSAEKPSLMYIPGNLWHGTMALEDTCTIYFLTKEYDEKNPDELRLDKNHKFEGVGQFPWGKYLA